MDLRSRASRGTVLGLAAVAALLPGGRQEPAPPPLFAFCMDTHDSRKRDLRQQAEMLKDLGYAGAGHLWLDRVEERLRTLEEAGLRLFQIYLRGDVSGGAKPGVDPRLGEVLPLLRGRGVQLALLLQGLRPRDPAGEPRARELVRGIADRAGEAGVEVVLYHHVGDWMERVEDALRVAEEVDRPNVKVMFNLCHWMKTGEEAGLRGLLGRAAPRLGAVSLNGSDTMAEVKSGKGRWIQPLGSGSYDLLGFLRILRDIGYKGPVGLQCYGIGGDAREHLGRSMAAWRELNARLAGPARGS